MPKTYKALFGGECEVYFNAPTKCTEDELIELAREAVKQAVKDPATCTITDGFLGAIHDKRGEEVVVF